MHTSIQQGVIYALSFSSGFSIMGIELLGGRILAPYFGSSIYIWGSIITVFMLSLSMGYLLGGKLSTLSTSLKHFAFIFILSGICVLPVGFYATALMELIFIYIEDSRYGSLLAATALFLIPTTILGMISPYAIRLLVKNTDESGKVAGKLYFTSTLGSALGTIFTSFYLVLWFDINQIIFGFSFLLISLGGLAISLHVNQKTSPQERSQHA